MFGELSGYPALCRIRFRALPDSRYEVFFFVYVIV